MTRLNTQFSVKGISLLNSVMASSSSVQFKKFLFNQVDDIAGNEVSPTKQARGDSGKEPKLIGDRTEKKNLGRNQAQSGGPFLLWPDDTAVQFQLLQSQIGWLNWFPRSCPDGRPRWRGPHWGSVSGAHLGVLVSADVQGCRGSSLGADPPIWSGECSDLGIRKKQTNISVDVNLFTM